MAKRIANTKTGIRKLHTSITERDGLFEVKLYNTYVYSEEGNTITLDNGGWVTPTTVSRMNQALIHRGIAGVVLIHKGEMFFQYNVYKAGKPVCRYPFTNGVYVITKTVA